MFAFSNAISTNSAHHYTSKYSLTFYWLSSAFLSTAKDWMFSWLNTLVREAWLLSISQITWNISVFSSTLLAKEYYWTVLSQQWFIFNSRHESINNRSILYFLYTWRSSFFLFAVASLLFTENKILPACLQNDIWAKSFLSDSAVSRCSVKYRSSEVLENQEEHAELSSNRGNWNSV